MSVHVIYYKDGAKFMKPVLTREEYLQLRGSEKQREVLKTVREKDERQKNRLLQMNYSCLPGEDGALRGATRLSTTVGMDVDHIKAEEMTAVRDRILEKKDELGLLMLERSARGAGYHLVFRRRAELSQEENLQWASELLGVAFDAGAKDITRVFFTTTADEEELIFLDERLFENEEAVVEEIKNEELKIKNEENCQLSIVNYQLEFKGIPYSSIIAEYWRQTGGEPTEGERNKRLHQLAANLRAVCDNSEAWLLELMPRYGLSEEEMRGIIHSACTEPTKGSRLMDRIVAALDEERKTKDDNENEENNVQCSMLNVQWKKLPQGVRESIDAVGPTLSMPVLTAVCPAIGALATGVTLDVHGQKKGLNLIAYIAGDFASGKGSIDPVVDAWMSEVRAQDTLYQQQEDEWRAKKRAAKNKKEQPEEPKLPVRCLTLNNTVANLAERLANTEGRHAFSFTPEADTVAQKWKTSLSDFSVMLRQSYDGSKYDREAKSADAVNVHIERLLWNVTMCGTPDALYRVVSNYTDGFQSRIALARTPDNTFAPLEDKPYVLTPYQTERIQQIAHLLTQMKGEFVLPKLEARGREWLENIRLSAIENDDRVMARQRFRVCVTAQRMTCCVMLCKVAEQLIQKHGLNGAEKQLQASANLLTTMLQKAQTPQMMQLYGVIADSLLENALHFFRDRIENAFASRDYSAAQGSDRTKRGKNDSIFARLEPHFAFEQATQQSIAVKGLGVTRNSVQQMLKNWRKQGLVVQLEDGSYRKVER